MTRFVSFGLSGWQHDHAGLRGLDQSGADTASASFSTHSRLQAENGPRSGCGPLNLGFEATELGGMTGLEFQPLGVGCRVRAEGTELYAEAAT